MAEKQFAPTQKKLIEALIDGKSKRSQLFSWSILLMLSAISLDWSVRKNWLKIVRLLECLWSQEISRCSVMSELKQVFLFVPVLLLLIAVILQLAQVGVYFLPATLFPRLKRISPAAGFMRILLGLQSFPVILLKLVVFFIIFTIGALFLLHWLSFSSYLFLQQNILYFIDGLRIFVAVLCVFAIMFGISDLISQRRKFKDQVFFDFDQMKREFREQEGDPVLKAHRKALHRAITEEELIKVIKKAKVIIVEPNNLSEELHDSIT